MNIISKWTVVGIISAFPAIMAGQETNQGSMPQYMFASFDKATVLMKSGQVQSQEMNYNMVTKMMVFVRDKKYYDLTNADMVDTIYLQDCRMVPVGKEFYELLYSGKIVLFAEYYGNLLPAGKPVGYGGTSQVSSSNYLSTINLSSGQYNLPLPSDYVVKVTTIYWIRKGGNMDSFENEKQFLKLFPEKTDKLKSFIKQNKIKFNNTEHVTRLVKFCSSI